MNDAVGDAVQELNGTYRHLAAEYVLGILSGTCLLSCFVWSRRSEVQVIKRVQTVIRCLCALLMLAQVPLALAYYMRGEPFRPPFYSVGRPLLAGVVSFFGFFVTSHPFMRLLFLFGQVTFVLADSVSQVMWTDHYHCVQAEACVDRHLSVTHLQWLVYRDVFTIVLQIWNVLLASYISLIIGWLLPRIPARMFATPAAQARLPKGIHELAAVNEDSEEGDDDADKLLKLA